jgi:starch synthase
MILGAGGKVGTGWTYSPCDVPAMLEAVDLALTTYRSHPESWKKLMLSGMSQDLSWNKAAEQYEQIFEWALLDPPARAG